MSAVRFFNNIPHIVRYGMHSEADEKCWIWFWRNGVRFKIWVLGEDVQGTDFYQQWKPLINEHDRGSRPLSQWAEEQWHPLCDLIISTSMPALQRLAPDREYWVTLRDYLHTPAYGLRLFAAGDGETIETRVEEGPFDTGAYGLVPVSQAELPVPSDLPRYSSSDLRVLDQEKDWRQKPSKVCDPSGRVFVFEGCEQSTRHNPGGQIYNTSLDRIRARLQTLAEQDHEDTERAQKPGAVSGVVRLVADIASPKLEPDGNVTAADTDGGEGVMVAGLLLTHG